MLRAVLFDLDGTLIDSMELIWRSYAHALREGLGIEADREAFLEGVGRPLRWQFGRLTEDPGRLEALVTAYRAFNKANHDAMVSAFHGVADGLRALRGRSLGIGIVTAKLHVGARRGLARAGLDELVDVVVGADDVSPPKPDPAPVRAALQALRAAPGEALMVGDSPHDLAAGRAAGTRIAAVAWGPFPRGRLEACEPDLWLESPAEIAALS
jgi:pyrophosphatase PpaX